MRELGILRTEKLFNSHPHKEDDGVEMPQLRDVFHLFNSHPHKEDDYKSDLSLAEARIFNSHPHKEDDFLMLLYGMLGKFFNSHPHKEDDDDSKAVTDFKYFSTHILTRRMTKPIAFVILDWIFQLTSSQGG